MYHVFCGQITDLETRSLLISRNMTVGQTVTCHVASIFKFLFTLRSTAVTI